MLGFGLVFKSMFCTGLVWFPGQSLLQFDLVFWSMFWFILVFWSILRFGLVFCPMFWFSLVFWWILRFGLVFWWILRFGLAFVSETMWLTIVLTLIIRSKMFYTIKNSTAYELNTCLGIISIKCENKNMQKNLHSLN